MIVWINGAFGSGKTTTAFELHYMLRDSFVYDPEIIGFFLHRHLPEELRRGDFQDIPLWRKFNYETLKYIASDYNGTVIVPMTIKKPEYYHEIITRLRDDGIRVDHYVLGASAETLVKRGRSRLCFGNSWSVRQIPACIEAFGNPLFENYIETDTLGIYDIIKIIASKSNLELLDDNKNRLQKWLRRKKTQIRHIRKM